VNFAVRYSAAAREDLTRLYEHLLEGSTSAEDMALADRAIESIETAVNGLARAPFIHRKAGASPFLRELVISFGRSGYVALFEIEDATTVTVLAVRHQLEDDYH
jgi:plasmid stabilization system protein ParE